MNRDTNLKVWANRQADETLEQRIARLAAAAPGTVDGQQAALPDASPLVDLALVTTTELHDLIHAAASTYLQTLSGMTRTRALHHAERIASTGLQMTAGQDYMHRGTDPRG